MLDFSFSIVDETTTALMFTRNEARFFALAISTKTSPTLSVVRSKYYFWQRRCQLHQEHQHGLASWYIHCVQGIWKNLYRAATEHRAYLAESMPYLAQSRVQSILTLMGSKMYAMLRSITALRKSKELNFTEIVNTLARHVDPKPIIIAERYKFYKAEQEE